MEITNGSHRTELLSAIRDLFPESHFPDGYVASEMHSLASTPGSQHRILYPVPLVSISSGSSVYDNQNSMGTNINSSTSSIDREFVSGSSCRNMTCQPNTEGERLDCDSGTSPSQAGFFGTDLASHANSNWTDTSVVSNIEWSKRGSPVWHKNVHGSGTFKNADCSKLIKHHRKTQDIQRPIISVSPGPHMGHEHHLPNKKNRKKLILTLEPNQIPENGDADMTEKIKSWFVGLDGAVTVKRMEGQGNIYTIIFRDVGAANEALKFRDKGLNIRNKYYPRASPTRHIKYRALADLLIRKGKSLRGNFIRGVVKRGKSVWVDQVKGRRARVINRGWVSLYTTDGIRLLKQDLSC